MVEQPFCYSSVVEARCRCNAREQTAEGGTELPHPQHIHMEHCAFTQVLNSNQCSRVLRRSGDVRSVTRTRFQLIECMKNAFDTFWIFVLSFILDVMGEICI